MNATAAGINATYIQGYAKSITDIINGILVPTLISLAFIVFLWGIYNYFIKGADDPKAQETGRTFTLYGIIGFVVLFSVWGIVQIFMGTLGLDSTTKAPAFPTIGTSGGTVDIGHACDAANPCMNPYVCYNGFCAANNGTGTPTYFPSVGNNTSGTPPAGGYVSIPTYPANYSNPNVSSSQLQQWQNASVAYTTACATNKQSAQCAQATQNYASIYDAVNKTDYSASTQPSSDQNATNAYNSYESCIAARSSSDPVCKSYLSQYTQSGGATCGTLFTSVCAPGSTCLLGFCKSIAADSVAEGGRCNGNPTACMQGLTCDTSGTCIQPTAGSEGQGGRCSEDSQCTSGLTCDMNASASTYLTCIGGGGTPGTCGAAEAADCQSIGKTLDPTNCTCVATCTSSDAQDCENYGGTYDMATCTCTPASGYQCQDPVDGHVYDNGSTPCPTTDTGNNSGSGAVQCTYSSDCGYGDVCTNGTCVSEGW